MNNRAYYDASISEFLGTSSLHILGELTSKHSHDLDDLQKKAWVEQTEILKDQLAMLGEGHIFLEFGIPRMGKRADVVFVYRGVVFVIEFKVGTKEYRSSDIDQVIDYCLDLKNFHEGSHYLTIVPVLSATKAPGRKRSVILDSDRLVNHQFSHSGNLAETINSCIEKLPIQKEIDPLMWASSRYKPTPTIIQAAQALYANHDVKDISRCDAGATNLTVTANTLSEIIEYSKQNNQKSICFVTGVPGSGKTLAGLNVTTTRMDSDIDEHAVFLSGNGPLVMVLREALARDEVARNSISKKGAIQKTSAFIQNIHHFRDDNLVSTLAPVEQVVVFDEAQRAWDADHTTKFMSQKKGLEDFEKSEPEFLIEVMDRHEEWCVVIALIGGGQEINTGEAGLPEWFSALNKKFKHWNVHYSDVMDSDEYIRGGSLEDQLKGLRAIPSSGLHLGVSLRSFRAEKLSAFVHHVIANNPESARAMLKDILPQYPICITRDLDAAKAWLKGRARGGELYGLLASSGAARLKPYGINVKVKIAPDLWFLNGRQDVRACQYLEDVGTEFDVQGLELDWCCVGWDADLRYNEGLWCYHAFKGTKWQNVGKPERQRYLENAYRVLLTRSRQGFIIFIPEGSSEDCSRYPEYYEQTYEYLKACGVPDL